MTFNLIPLAHELGTVRVSHWETDWSASYCCLQCRAYNSGRTETDVIWPSDGLPSVYFKGAEKENEGWVLIVIVSLFAEKNISYAFNTLYLTFDSVSNKLCPYGYISICNSLSNLNIVFCKKVFFSFHLLGVVVLILYI